MALIFDAVAGILSQPTLGGALFELAVFLVPLWVAMLGGLLLGWAWRPRWVAEVIGGLKADLGISQEEGAVAFPVNLSSSPSSLDSSEAQLTSCAGLFGDGSLQPAESEELAVTTEDLRLLCRLVEERDGGPMWHKMMDRSLPKMRYRAWQRDPENGPPQYQSSTVFEDASPEVVRDFFWDDEFRMKNGWDDMLLHHETLEECLTTGTMVVRWVRKFPFFCSDREYIIGRRIWESGRTYYCVTKGVPSSSVPRRNKPRRVDLYYSSWCIRPVESRGGDGQMTSCEVVLFHHEDMGIPWEIAKLGVRRGMWGCVKRIEPGLRDYQVAQASHEPVSRCVKMAQINTKFVSKDLLPVEANTSSSTEVVEAEEPRHWTGNIPKALLIGGAVTLVCSLDRGLVTKAVIFGVARRFAKLGKRL